jgi:hypothetical protein
MSEEKNLEGLLRDIRHDLREIRDWLQKKEDYKKYNISEDDYIGIDKGEHDND